MSTTAMLVAFISLLRLALLAGIVYLAVLLVRALRKYLRTQDARKEKAETRRSLGEVLKSHRIRCQMTQEFVAESLGVSRQAVCDNLTRTEALLRRMEENIGCVRRSLTTRKAVQEILNAAAELKESSDPAVSTLADRILSAAQALKE